jgi:hypothetical protein
MDGGGMSYELIPLVWSYEGETPFAMSPEVKLHPEVQRVYEAAQLRWLELWEPEGEPN